MKGSQITKLETSPNSMLGKAAVLLSTLATIDIRTPMGLSELARTSGLSKSTVYRIANELSDLRLLEKAKSGYSLGLWLFELGQQVPRYHNIAHLAAPFCEDLHKATQQTVHFGIRDGTDMIYLLKVRDHRGIDEPSRIAGRMPVHCTATGRAILAFERDDVIREVFEAGLEPKTPYTTVHPPALMQKIRQARSTGVTTEIEEIQLGLGAVASPILGADGPIAAIGLVLKLRDGRPDQFRSAVRTSALYLTRMLRGAN